MKFATVAAFEKHLKEAFPDHLAPVFILAIPCDFERQMMLQKIVEVIHQKDPSAHVLKFSEESPIETVLSHLNSPGLFSKHAVSVYDGAAKNEKLSHYAQHPAPGAFLLIGSRDMKALADVYQKGKKDVVVLDLSEEKPWDRERRLQDFVLREAHKQGRRMEPAAAALLLELVGPDMPSLFHEVEKIICFAGDKTQITSTDVEAVSKAHHQATLWKLAESVIWGKEGVSAEKSSDLSFTLPFLGQLRYQLEIGHKMSQLKGKRDEISRQLPQLRPATLEKYLSQFAKKRQRFFQDGLIALYEFEVALKSSGLDPDLLLDRFIAKLHENTPSAS
ncbi:MAG: hypothetical protein JSR58_07760 [Verrucomicrobia bacterium]|nr:hypothetical protein [Verrucomicrobiota bacterium]